MRSIRGAFVATELAGKPSHRKRPMKSILIDGHEAEDIGSQVQKILSGLGNPKPPLRVDDALELLRLDRGYYSSANQGAIREYVSRMMVAGKQLIKRPTLLLDVIKKARLSALWLPDRKRILIDESIPKLKHRWNEAHEIGHSIIPWHQDTCSGTMSSPSIRHLMPRWKRRRILQRDNFSFFKGDSKKRRTTWSLGLTQSRRLVNGTGTHSRQLCGVTLNMPIVMLQL